LVKEFTELQGIVGGLYASVQELDSDLPDATRQLIAQTIYDQYKPESMDDSVPRSVEGAVLSIADKADSIAGMFALGLQPTGSKDPFALRRQANGIVKTIAEKKLPLKLSTVVKYAFDCYSGSDAVQRFSKPLDWWRDNLKAELLTHQRWMDAIKQSPQSESHVSPLTFLWDRVQFYLGDAKCYAYDVVRAVTAAGADDVVDAIARAEAVKQVRGMPDFQRIGAACKRVRNILRQALEKGVTPAAIFEYFPDEDDGAKSFRAKLETIIPRVEERRAKKEYLDALLLLGTLRDDVDRFFDTVMVMVDDERIRANRLALLQTLLREFSTIADFSEIVIEGKESKESSKQ